MSPMRDKQRTREDRANQPMGARWLSFSILKYFSVTHPPPRVGIELPRWLKIRKLNLIH